MKNRNHIMLGLTAITVLGVLVLNSRRSEAQTATTTKLMYTFVSNQPGYDTGIEISNTTADPFGTAPAGGACKLFFYGTGAPTPVITPVIGAGQNYEMIASAIAPGFQGYVIANCNFPLAHGFSFITAVPTGQFLGSSPALVIRSPRTAPEGLSN